MEDADELALLLKEAAATGSWRRVYEQLRASMRYAAAQGARRVGVRDPSVIDGAVESAFRELMDRDPEEITNPRALARTISYRRGVDGAREITRRWRMEEPKESLAEESLRATPGQEGGASAGADTELLSAEALWQRERTYWCLQKCLGRLATRERVVIKEHVENGRTLAAVGAELGVSHTTVRKIREKALATLRKCLAEHEDEEQRTEERGEAW
jgi:RNA polymerase sigma factor (sigma-70 family)